MGTNAKEMLQKQLKLLSERSQDNTIGCQSLADMSEAMVKVIQEIRSLDIYSSKS